MSGTHWYSSPHLSKMKINISNILVNIFLVEANYALTQTGPGLHHCLAHFSCNRILNLQLLLKRVTAPSSENSDSIKRLQQVRQAISGSLQGLVFEF